MKKRLKYLIEKVIGLLHQCGYNEKAEWFKEKLKIFNNCEVDSNEFQKNLREIKNILGGMGSFSDLSMVPGEGTNLSEDEARELQWKLSEELYDEIAKLLKK